MKTVKFMLLGATSSGKTSLIKSLTTGAPRLCHQSTEGVEVIKWKPDHNYAASQVLDALQFQRKEDLYIEFCDTTGRKKIFDNEMIFLLICASLNPSAVEDILHLTQLIQHKVPGGKVIIVITKKSHISEVESVEDFSARLLIELTDQEDKWFKVLVNNLSDMRQEQLLTKHIHLQQKIVTVDLETNEGMDELLLAILTAATEKLAYSQIAGVSEFTPRSSPDGISTQTEQTADTNFTYNVKLNRDSKSLNIMESLQEESQPMIKAKESNASTSLDVWSLTNAACFLHFDSLNRSFKFNSSKFWPKGYGDQKPSPNTLIKLLEEIPTLGIVRESLLPLLWQSENQSEKQILQLIEALTTCAVLYKMDDNAYYTNLLEKDNIKLSKFPSLSSETIYCLPLLHSSTLGKPAVNWSDIPFEGDIHISVVFSFPNKDIGQSFRNQVLVVCQQVSSRCTYKHSWKNGFLCKYAEEVTVHIYFDDCFNLHVCARGPYDLDFAVISLLWISLKPYLNAVYGYLANLPGLIYFMNVQVSGYPLVVCSSGLQKSNNSRYITVPLWECISAIVSRRRTVVEDDLELNIDFLFSFTRENSLPNQIDKTISLFDLLLPMGSIEDYIPFNETTIKEKENVDIGESKNLKPVRVYRSISWRPEIDEEIDANTKEKHELQQSVTLPHTSMRKLIHKIASSIVASVVTQAMITVLQQKNSLQTYQIPAVELVARAVGAGSEGNTLKAIESLNQALKLLQVNTTEQNKKQSRICVIL